MRSEPTSTLYPLSLVLGSGVTLTLWAPLSVAAGLIVAAAGTAYVVKKLRSSVPRRQLASPQPAIKPLGGLDLLGAVDLSA